MKFTKITLLLAIVLSTATLSVSGQNHVIVKQDSYAIQGDSVYVNMNIDLNGVKPARRAFVLLTPYLEAGKEIAMDLPSVMIEGKNRYRAHKRLLAINREPDYVGMVIDGSSKKAPRKYTYLTAVPYEQWMSRASLGVREDQCRCNGPITPVSYDLIAGAPEDRNPPVVNPELVVDMLFTVSFKVPDPEPVKMRSEVGKAYLDFPAGKSTINPSFGNNRAELDKIGHTIRLIKDDPYTKITNIVIDGYASPEGKYATNMTLSGKRAVALKENLKSSYGLKDNLFRVQGRGEDWATLEELVRESSMPYKDEVLAIVQGVDVFDGREKKLMELKAGNPYRDMLQNIFPRLRRSDYEVKYSVIPFTAEQGRETIKTNPGLLSLNEMFLIAQLYEVGSEEYNNVFTVAAQQFPQSDVANMNAAANALSRHDSQTAMTYLNKVSNRDAAWSNNMGVAYAQQADYDKAVAQFKKAQADGNAEAKGNLEQIAKLEDARANSKK